MPPQTLRALCCSVPRAAFCAAPKKSKQSAAWTGSPANHACCALHTSRKSARMRIMKTAYELAMERLKKKDEEAGIASKPVTDAQRAHSAEIRNFYEAKLAEAQVMHQSKLQTVFDPAERETLEKEYRRERERLTDERERKIEKVRGS